MAQHVNVIEPGKTMEAVEAKPVGEWGLVSLPHIPTSTPLSSLLPSPPADRSPGGREGGKEKKHKEWGQRD